MLEGFEFVDNERTFTCMVEKAQALGNEPWWWFTVSTDDRQRYAPFRAASGDTQKSVRERIVKYYDELLERRAAPATPYWRRGPQPNDAAKPAAAAPEPAAAPAKAAAAKTPAAKKAPAAKSAKSPAKPAKSRER
ncbi:MAG TPA: hypothetical protein VFT41_01415 [Gemmatimonadaceae bacterium]|nr:hypothetical protein [Gemmatimonadaceae bacterium]